MPERQRHLRPVDETLPNAMDPSTGEMSIAAEDPRYPVAIYVRGLMDEVKGLQRDIAGWTRRHAELQRDKQAEAEADPLWPTAVHIFRHWQETCAHTGAEWTWERFELIRPFLKRKKYGAAMCVRAIGGAAYDPFVTTRKNGSTHRHDEWELIFANPGKFESFCNRAPKGWTLPEGVIA